jgi:hypothetical protein
MHESDMIPSWQLPQESHYDYELRAKLVVNNRPRERSPETRIPPKPKKKEKSPWR